MFLACLPHFGVRQPILDPSMSEHSDEDEYCTEYATLFSKQLSLLRSQHYSTQNDGPISSMLPPTTFWTADEKELFFQGLRRYSKLRPDLIALHIGSNAANGGIGSNKTTADVCAYIDALEDGIRQGDIEPIGSHPVARVVSDEWIAFEEQQSKLLAAKEMEWEEARRLMDREKIWDEIKASIMEERQKRMAKDAKSRRKDVHTHKQRPTEKGKGSEEPEEWERRCAELAATWNREDAMESLGEHELSFLDSLIRRELEGIQMSDPLALPSNPATSQQQPSINASASSNTNGSTTVGDVGLDSRTPEPSPQELSSMTAVERRRIQKRLHMRRKRAEAAGNVAVEDPTRLKPGRKTTRNQPSLVPRPRESSEEPSKPLNLPKQAISDKEDSEDDKDEKDGEVDQPKYKPRGLTLLQKVQQRFHELQINYQYVHGMDLDLFNLSKFTSLCR